MQIRSTTDPPRIEWKEMVTGRTVTVTLPSLERYGVVERDANGATRRGMRSGS